MAALRIVPMLRWQQSAPALQSSWNTLGGMQSTRSRFMPARARIPPRAPNARLRELAEAAAKSAASSAAASTDSSNTAEGTAAAAATDKKKVEGPPELLEKTWQLEFHQQEKGLVAGKRPVKVTLQKGRKYSWCTCGYSRNQPMCDGHHRFSKLRCNLKPMIFKAPADMDVWLCTCKQSDNRPFCDGSHRSEMVQEANVGNF